ncbi:FtsX-like permease family protein [uncultured Parolsenella sp.]|uniref:FtsX-like permease family protein n=1 Tax=uncultured Parolsenella sp. TaxID=2083008 RepID=UPI0027DB07D9|nr:FtsX-like permease family protein [uncultured Parolsenella sp.]
MRSALATDTLRTIRHSARRFLALAAICVLGTTMLIGLTIACEDLRLSADSFFDDQRLYDVSVQSTLGLTNEDVDALAALDGVDSAQGSWSETAYTEVGDARQSVSVSSIAKGGMNEPYLLEGRLPKDGGELATTSEYLEASGKRIGDTVTFGVDADASTWAADDASEHQREKAADLLDKIADDEDGKLTEDERKLLDDVTAADLARAAESDGIDLDRWADLSDNELTNLLTDAYEGRFDDIETDTGDSTELFARHTYTIVGEVIDPTSVAAKNGSASFRSTGSKYSFFVTDKAATAEAYSVVYLRVAGTDGLSCFSDEYERRVAAVKDEAEAIKAQREDAREQQIARDGNARIDDAEASANEQFDKVEDQLAEAQATIDDAMAQIETGREQLASQKASALDALAAAQGQINAGRAQLADPATREAAVAQAHQAADEALEANEQYQQGKQALDTLTQVRDAYDALAQAKASLEAQIDQLKESGQDATQAKAQLDAVTAQMAALEAQQGVKPEQLPALIEQAQAQLDAARQSAHDSADKAVDEQLAGMSSQLDEAQATLNDQRAQALRMLDEAAAQLADAQAQADKGQATLDDSRAEYEDAKANALAKIADARAKLASVGSATWYVQDRSAISSFASIDTDASCIETIGVAFPAIFLTVAILVSLTTAARMVEEERGLIGLYKALGYPRGQIMGKYVLYTTGAAVVGGIVGSVLGFVALPEFLFTFFRLMYTFPEFSLHFSAGLCALACGMFVAGIGLATALTVRRELAEQPAQLMRPRAPKAGKRILLERVRPVWNRLSFLNKVTARNLFRYKGRLAMTVFGVAGCCALMIAGFAINDTVQALSANQYGADGRAGIYAYDVLAATQPDDLESAAGSLTTDARVRDYTTIRTENVSAGFGDALETVQLVVVPDGFSLDGYIDLRGEDGSHLSLADATADGGVLVTKSLASVTGLAAGDDVSLQDTSLNRGEAKVDAVVMNYLGDAIYMSQSTCEATFGERLEANALLAHLNGTTDEKIAYADELASDTTFLSVVSTPKAVRDFSNVFMLISCVTVLLTVLAAGLSFVVLLTLSATNVSERERELATIKVLGFRKRETRTYINKEMLILALIGTLAGIPLGIALSHALTYVLNMPSMYFAVEIAPASILASCGLSLLFALIVCIISRRSIDRIDMVGALKSAE